MVGKLEDNWLVLVSDSDGNIGIGAYETIKEARNGLISQGLDNENDPAPEIKDDDDLVEWVLGHTNGAWVIPPGRVGESELSWLEPFYKNLR